MNEQEIEIITHKVADILTERFDARQQKIAEQMMDRLWNTPFPKTQSDYEAEMKGKTAREIMDGIKCRK